MHTVICTLKARNIQVALMTPPPFDTSAYAANGNILQPLGLEQYGYSCVYEGYAQVMETYARWVREELSASVDCVIDTWQALSDDNTTNSGDGIHPNLHGHWVIARQVLQDLFGICAPRFEEQMECDAYGLYNLMHKYNTLQHRSDKETVGHDNMYKDEYLSGAELSDALEASKAEIDAYISSHPELFCLCGEWQGYRRDLLHFEGYEVIIAYWLPRRGRAHEAFP